MASKNPIIGSRKFFDGNSGDRINALMSAFGYNFCKLLRVLACLVFFTLRWCRISLDKPLGSYETRIWDFLKSLFLMQIRIA
jgi:hypothetical protein